MTTPNRFLPALAIAVALGALALLGYLDADTPRRGGARVLLPNKGGPVLFTHVEHQESFKVPCMTCHHTGLGAAGNPPPCRDCHPGEFGDDWAANHAENMSFDDPALCGGCHHTYYNDLKFDHEKHIAMYGVQGCRKCHHSPKTWPEPQACDVCHGPTDVGPVVSLAKANHLVCGRCHQQAQTLKLDDCGYCHVQAKDPSAVPGGLVSCSECHEKSIEEMVPTSTEAYHGKCMGCHETSGGPAGQQCSRCHIS